MPQWESSYWKNSERPKRNGRIEISSMPTVVLLRVSRQLARLDPVTLALTGGEDYELLLSVAPADVAAVQEATASVGVTATVIGEIARSGLRVLHPDGRETELAEYGNGWDHFTP
jgi:thiamine monophosphate kinase